MVSMSVEMGLSELLNFGRASSTASLSSGVNLYCKLTLNPAAPDFHVRPHRDSAVAVALRLTNNTEHWRLMNWQHWALTTPTLSSLKTLNNYSSALVTFISIFTRPRMQHVIISSYHEHKRGRILRWVTRCPVWAPQVWAPHILVPAPYD